MKAALLTGINKPLEIFELEVLPLTFGQVQVRVLVSGICGAQLQEIAGTKAANMPLPRPMGHEGCGIVEEIGPGVRHVKVGDKVVMHWRKGAGIESENPRYVLSDGSAFAKATADDALPHITGGLLNTFMEETVASENRLTAVPQDTPVELCALLGCSLSTALACLENEAGLRRGESILIVGCGGLGAALIMAASLTGAYPIVCTDVIEEKAAVAAQLGADGFVPFDPHTFMVEEKRPSLVKDGFDVIVETSGSPAAIHSTAPLLAPSGRFIMVGQPKPGQRISLENANHFFEGSGKLIRATQGGGYMPHLDCPRYVKFFAHGRLTRSIWNHLVSHRFSLADINKGIIAVRNGEAGRVMIQMQNEELRMQNQDRKPHCIYHTCPTPSECAASEGCKGAMAQKAGDHPKCVHCGYPNKDSLWPSGLPLVWKCANCGQISQVHNP